MKLDSTYHRVIAPLRSLLRFFYDSKGYNFIYLLSIFLCASAASAYFSLPSWQTLTAIRAKKKGAGTKET